MTLERCPTLWVLCLDRTRENVLSQSWHIQVRTCIPSTSDSATFVCQPRHTFFFSLISWQVCSPCLVLLPFKTGVLDLEDTSFALSEIVSWDIFFYLTLIPWSPLSLEQETGLSFTWIRLMYQSLSSLGFLKNLPWLVEHEESPRDSSIKKDRQ